MWKSRMATHWFVMVLNSQGTQSKRARHGPDDVKIRDSSYGQNINMSQLMFSENKLNSSAQTGTHSKGMDCIVGDGCSEFSISYGSCLKASVTFGQGSFDFAVSFEGGVIKASSKL